MNIETKYAVGQDVCLFNAISQEIEHDEVYAILVAPVPVKGESKVIDPNLKVSENLRNGNAVVGCTYQLQRHQGLLDEKILFGSEAELKKFYAELFESPVA